VPHIHVQKLLEEIEGWGKEMEQDILKFNLEKHKKLEAELKQRQDLID